MFICKKLKESRQLQSIKWQARANEDNADANLYLSLCIRVCSNDGTTIRGTILSLTRDDVEFDSTTYVNRQFTATSDSGDINAQEGDRIVIEIGQGGDPVGGGSHNDGAVGVGDNASTDLPENDTETAAYNPWVELADTLDFEREEVYLEASLRNDLIIDSLDYIQIRLVLQDEFGIEITDDVAKKFETIKDIVEYIKERKNK